MNNNFLILCLLFVSYNMYSQCCTPQQACNLRSIGVGSGNANSLTLSHVGPASIQPTAGQQTNWNLGTTTNPNLTNVTTTSTNGLFTFNLTALGISTSDIIVATCIITSTTGSICSINNQNIVWTMVGSPPFTSFQWRVTLPAVTGIFSQPPLPVEWVFFDGKSSHGDAYLSWSTASEINNEGYYVQVSTQDSPWEIIGFVNGKGNTSDFSYYDFVHQNAPNERLFYKLIQVDYDGRTDDSDVIIINNSNKEDAIENIKIYPNPGNGKVTIDIGSAPTKVLHINIYNSLGQFILSRSQNDLENSLLTLDLPQKGFYFIHTNKDGISHTTRVLVE